MELFFDFDGKPINVFRNHNKFVIRASLLSDRCYHAEYLSSVTSITIIEKSFLIRVFGNDMRVFKDPTREEFLTLGRIYNQMLVAQIMEE